MPRKYPDFQTNPFDQKIECGSKVVFITSTFRKWTGVARHRLHRGTVVKINMDTVRIEYSYKYKRKYRRETEPGYWEWATRTVHRIDEADVKPEYVYVTG